MNREKTGALIAAARKEHNLTQKELAKELHVSDRAVSKWERGAGFPDVSLLEPLAAALDLQVLDLLQGEIREPAAEEPTVRQVIALLLRQTRERTRRRWSQILASVCLLALSGFVLFGMLDYGGAFLRPVSLEVPVGVYVDGERVGESTVSIEGERRIFGKKTYEGRFAIELVEKTCREGVNAYIRWDALDPGGEQIQYHGYGMFFDAGVESWLYITEDLRSFGLKLEDGTILATDLFYVPLLMADYYYSLAPVVSTW